MGLLFLGLLMFAIGIWGLFYCYNMKKNGISVMAEVVDIVRSSSLSNTVDRHLPLFQYKVDGELINSAYRNAKNDAKYEIGDRIEIIYNPRKPKKFIIPTDIELRSAIAFLILGPVVIVWGLL